MKFESQYKSNPVQFPASNIPPEEKLKKEYNLQKCQAIYSAYVGDKSGFPYSLLSLYEEIRNYADGRQDPTKYEQLLYPDDTSTSVNAVTTTFDGDWNRKKKRVNTNNLNKEILSLAPRIMQAIQGAFSDVDYNINADTIDPDSGYEQEREKSQVYAEAQNRDILNQFMQNAGLPPEEGGNYPKDLDELQLMEDLGEFKTGIAKALEKLLKHTYEISDWDEVKRKLIKDIVCYNAICLRDVYDYEQHKWTTTYEDVSRVVAQYSDKRDYADSCYWGVIRERSVSELRPKLKDAGYTEEQIGSVAFSWSGLLNNPTQNKWTSFYSKDQYGNWLYDFYKCLVFEVTWIENDTIYKTVNINRRNVRTVYDQEWGRMRDTPHNKTRVTNLKRLYESKWIIGTQLVFDNQIAPSQPRNNNTKRPMSPFHIYAGTEASIMQRLIPVFDNFQITWLKLQEALIESWGEILMIDLTVLDRIKMGGEQWDTLKILKHAKKTHTFPHRSLPISGKYPGGNVKPLDVLPSTVMNRIDESIKLFQNALMMVEMVTGINPVSLGSQPNTGTGLGTTEIALQNTTKILRPIIDSVFAVKQKSAEFLAEAIRLGIRNDKECYDSYMRVVGENDVDALKKSTYEARELGIKLTPRPSTEELQSLYADVQAAGMQGKNGQPLIRFDTMLYIKEKLMNGANLSDIRLYLSNSINKEIERQQKEHMAAIQAQGQQNVQLEQQKVQGSMMQKEAETKAQVFVDNNKHRNNMQLEAMRLGVNTQQQIQDRELEEQQIEQENAEQRI